jgi:hypothetical protein
LRRNMFRVAGPNPKCRGFMITRERNDEKVYK